MQNFFDEFIKLNPKIGIEKPENILLTYALAISKKNEFYIKGMHGVYSGITGKLILITKCNLKFPFTSLKLKRSSYLVDCEIDRNHFIENGGVEFINESVQFKPIS